MPWAAQFFIFMMPITWNNVADRLKMCYTAQLHPQIRLAAFFHAMSSILIFTVYGRKCFYNVFFSCNLVSGNLFTLKELNTSETTLAQKIVLTAPWITSLNLKFWNSTSFMLKNPPIFLKKIYKNQFLASWRGLMVFIHKYKVVYF